MLCEHGEGDKKLKTHTELNGNLKKGGGYNTDEIKSSQSTEQFKKVGNEKYYLTCFVLFCSVPDDGKSE